MQYVVYSVSCLTYSILHMVRIINCTNYTVDDTKISIQWQVCSLYNINRVRLACSVSGACVGASFQALDVVNYWFNGCVFFLNYWFNGRASGCWGTGTGQESLLPAVHPRVLTAETPSVPARTPLQRFLSPKQPAPTNPPHGEEMCIPKQKSYTSHLVSFTNGLF